VLWKAIFAGEYISGIQAKRELLESLFAASRRAREPYAKAKQAVIEAINGDPFRIIELNKDEQFLNKLRERAGLRAQYEDTAAALIVLCAVSLERLYHATGDSLFEHGEKTYAGQTFSRAVCTLANSYKHLGEQINKPRKKHTTDRELIVSLASEDNVTGACAEFLLRFSDYRAFELCLQECGKRFEKAGLSIKSVPGFSEVALTDPHGYFKAPDTPTD
jgi:hypothetical protein